MTPEDQKQISKLKSVFKWNTNISILNQIQAIESKYSITDKFPEVKINLPDIPVFTARLKKYPKVVYSKNDFVTKSFNELQFLWNQYKKKRDFKTMKRITEIKHSLNKYRKTSI